MCALSASLHLQLYAQMDAEQPSLAGSRPQIRGDMDLPVLVPTMALQMQHRIERTFLLSAINNVFRSQDRLPEVPNTAMEEESVLKHLRKISEHWDERGRSARNIMETEHARELFEIQERLAELRGTEELARFREMAKEGLWAVFELPFADGDEVWLSGVPLTRIEVWLVDVRQCLEGAIRTAGEHVLSLMDSCVDGDDATPWPGERKTYRLWREGMTQLPEWR